jgi:hypothetical protein
MTKVELYAIGTSTPLESNKSPSVMSGRVPWSCGYSFETSPKLPASSDSTSHEPSKLVFNPSLAPLGLHLRIPSLSTSRSFNEYPVLDRLHLGPRRHAVAQDLFERPDVIRQSRCHRRGARPPHLGRARSMSGDGLRQCLAQARMG